MERRGRIWSWRANGNESRPLSVELGGAKRVRAPEVRREERGNVVSAPAGEGRDEPLLDSEGEPGVAEHDGVGCRSGLCRGAGRGTVRSLVEG